MLHALCFKAYAQTTYYVATNGDDTKNNGLSAATPWKTIQKAANSANTPNSTVFIRGGTYKENVTVNVSGTAGQPITFKGYPGEKAILDGDGTKGTTLLTIKDKSYLNFENITIQNLTKNNAKGILIECTDTGTAKSLHFKKITITKINWNVSKTKEPGENDNAQPFIVYGRGNIAARAITDLVIDSSEFVDNIPGFSEVISIDGNVDGFTISNNRVHDNINIGIYAGGNYGECKVPELDHARNGLIINNTCYRNVALYATSGGIYADGSYDVIIQRNTCYENGYGIDVGAEKPGRTERITVIDNVIYNNQDAGITVGGYDSGNNGQVDNCLFRNNTLFNNDTKRNYSGEIYFTKASNCTFRNNIIYANALVNDNTLFTFDGEFTARQTGNTFNYNVYFAPKGGIKNIYLTWPGKGEYTEFAKYQSGTGQDKNSIYASAGFVNASTTSPDLHLTATSPCKDAGDPATVLLVGETDRDGQTRIVNNRIDIGAYESGTAGTVTSVANDIAIIELSAYPNPAQERITVKTNSEAPATLVLTDSHGEVKITKQTQGIETTLDVSGLSGGAYFLKVSGAPTAQVIRVIITRN